MIGAAIIVQTMTHILHTHAYEYMHVHTHTHTEYIYVYKLIYRTESWLTLVGRAKFFEHLLEICINLAGFYDR